MARNLPSTVGDKPADMSKVDRPEFIREWTEDLVNAWFRNGHLHEDNRTLTDHTYEVYLRRRFRGAYPGGFNVNEMRFCKQVWGEAANRNMAVGESHQ